MCFFLDRGTAPFTGLFAIFLRLDCQSARAHCDLSRHYKAIAMQDSAPEPDRRVLSENHADLGERRVFSCVACALLIEVR
jgi:hypothetical protein